MRGRYCHVETGASAVCRPPLTRAPAVWCHLLAIFTLASYRRGWLLWLTGTYRMSIRNAEIPVSWSPIHRLIQRDWRVHVLHSRRTGEAVGEAWMLGFCFPGGEGQGPHGCPGDNREPCVRRAPSEAPTGYVAETRCTGTLYWTFPPRYPHSKSLRDESKLFRYHPSFLHRCLYDLFSFFNLKTGQAGVWGWRWGRSLSLKLLWGRAVCL